MKEEIPNIINEPPAKNSLKLRKKDEKYGFATLFLSGKQLPIAIKRGKGAVLEDVDGNRFIDFTSGIAVSNVGHCNPYVIDAAKKQMDNLIHISQHIAHYETHTMLKEKLAEITPGDLKRSFLCNSGGEAIEALIKVSKFYSERDAFLGFTGAFHGQSVAAMSLSASSSGWKFGFQPLLPCVYHAPFPYCYRCPFGEEYPGCSFQCIEFLHKFLETVIHPYEIATIIAEPIQGEKGAIVPPPEFLPELRKICDENDIIFALDEVQTGFGRTGKMFACEHFGVAPDLMALAKGIAGGFPLGALVGKEEIMNQEMGHGSTFGGNPVSCAAALAAIDFIIKEKLPERAEKLGKLALKILKEVKEDTEIVGDLRGKGLLIGLEIVSDKDKKTPSGKLAERIREIAMKNGVLMVGQFGKNNIRVIPPLVISEELLEKGLNILCDAIKKVDSEAKK